jgi:hypothetical protein
MQAFTPRIASGYESNLAMVLRRYVAAFEAIGGAPREILYDRMYTAVTSEGDREGNELDHPDRHHTLIPTPIAVGSAVLEVRDAEGRPAWPKVFRDADLPSSMAFVFPTDSALAGEELVLPPPSVGGPCREPPRSV